MKANPKQSHYDRKYTDGDFKYNPERERAWLKTRLVERFRIPAGGEILDLGCGKGLHASLLADMGFKVYGVDLSLKGIQGAIARGSRAVFTWASADDLEEFFDPGQFDVIYCRGMSWFHYHLDRKSPQTGKDIREKVPAFFRFLKPGGLFVLQIATNFDGARIPGKVHSNRLSDYRQLFEPHGEIVHTSNWEGVELTSDEQAAQVKGGVVIATRKPAA